MHKRLHRGAKTQFDHPDQDNEDKDCTRVASSEVRTVLGQTVHPDIIILGSMLLLSD